MLGKVCKTIIILFVITSFSSVVAKNYTLVVEPIYPGYQSKEVYEPLRLWLSQKTGYQIELIIDVNYGFYWKKAKSSRIPDFTLDPSHIASYRQKYKNYHAIATTIEPVSFHLVSMDQPESEKTVEDFLIGKSVMMLPSPSYASELFNLWFTDLFSSPTKNVQALSWQDAVESIFDGAIDAAIIPSWMLSLYPSFNSLLASEEFPGPIFMASPNVPAYVIEEVKQALLSLQNDDESYQILVELNTKGFKSIEAEEFENLFKILPNESRDNNTNLYLKSES